MHTGNLLILLVLTWIVRSSSKTVFVFTYTHTHTWAHTRKIPALTRVNHTVWCLPNNKLLAVVCCRWEIYQNLPFPAIESIRHSDRIECAPFVRFHSSNRQQQLKRWSDFAFVCLLTFLCDIYCNKMINSNESGTNECERQRKRENIKTKGKDKSALWMCLAALRMMAINVDFIEWFGLFYEFRLDQMEYSSVRSLARPLAVLSPQLLNKLNYRSISVEFVAHTQTGRQYLWVDQVSAIITKAKFNMSASWPTTTMTTTASGKTRLLPVLNVCHRWSSENKIKCLPNGMAENWLENRWQWQKSLFRIHYE